MAHYIKQWRKHRRMTQEVLAGKIGMARSYLALIETGKRRYDEHFLEAASEALGCSPADLIMRDPKDPAGLWAVYDRLTEPEQRQAVELLEVLARSAKGGES